ncbi:MAG: V-type ATPase subunit, partial [Anaerolineae bacterium]|nr:V-type ATPase subunit [Anaerolineae bacterium]
MALPVSDYSVVQAVTRALYGDMLSQSAWQALIRASDYAAVLGLLSKSPYGPHLEIDRALLTPRRAVYQIRQHLAAVYSQLIDMSPAPAGRVLEKLFHHYEVDNVKSALRGFEARASWDHVLHLLYPMGRYTNVDIG